MSVTRIPGIFFVVGAALAALSAGTPRTAHAQAFVGGSIGAAHWSESPCEGSRPCEKRETAGTLRAGYRFSPYFGVEARYFDLGSISSRNPDLVPPPPAGTQVLVTHAKASARGAGVNAIVTWPAAERISVSGIAGIASTETKFRSESRLEPEGQATVLDGTIENRKRSTRPYYGVSVGYSLTPAWVLSIEAERYRPAFASTISADLVAVGLTYQFR